jgi:hypothetical protein
LEELFVLTWFGYRLHQPSRSREVEVRLVIRIKLLLIISQSGNPEFLCSAMTLDCLARGITVLDIARDQCYCIYGLWLYATIQVFSPPATVHGLPIDSGKSSMVDFIRKIYPQIV